MSIPKKQFQKLIDYIIIQVEYPSYDGDLYESVEFEHEFMIDDEIELIIKGWANFKFDNVVDDIFGRECEHIDFDIDTIEAFQENGKKFIASDYQKNKIKTLLTHIL